MSDPVGERLPVPTRIFYSPTAIGAFVLAAIGLARSTRIRFNDLPAEPLIGVVWAYASEVFVPAAGAVIALGLCRRARAEILASRERLVGIPLINVSRVFALFAIAAVTAALLYEVAIPRCEPHDASGFGEDVIVEICSRRPSLFG